MIKWFSWYLCTFTFFPVLRKKIIIGFNPLRIKLFLTYGSCCWNAFINKNILWNSILEETLLFRYLGLQATLTHLVLCLEHLYIFCLLFTAFLLVCLFFSAQVCGASSCSFVLSVMERRLEQLMTGNLGWCSGSYNRTV